MNPTVGPSTAPSHDMASPPGWEVSWAQRVGTRHRITEDALAYRAVVAPTRGATCNTGLYLAVADGVGGGARGDVASQALIQHCMALPKRLQGDATGLTEWMRLAEGEVQKALREVTFSPGAATLAAAWLDTDGNGHLLRVGDARLYRVSADGKVEALTADQSYDQVGETPPPGANGEDPARMVGTGFMGEPDLQALSLQPGEALLLCSDGLHRGLDTTAIAGLLQGYANLEDACLGLAEAARSAGSEDDISILVARRLCSTATQSSGFWARLWRRLHPVVSTTYKNNKFQ
ncbi:MAG: PP2C family protein-serine/threonine phosphatase [Methylobacter sp.]